MRDREQQRLHTVMVFVAGAVLCGLGLVSFLFFELFRLRVSVGELYEKGQTLLLEESHVKTLETFVRETSREQEAIRSYVIENKSEVTEFLLELEALADARSVSLDTTIGTEKRKVPAGGDTEQTVLKLGLVARGTFESIYTFIALLEEMHVKLSFDDMHLRRLTDRTLKKGEVPEWSATLTLIVYSYEE